MQRLSFQNRCWLFVIIIFTGTLFTGCSSTSKVSTTYTKEDIAAAINADKWISAVHYATPQYGRSRNITGSYDVQCKKDTVIFYLPYFGRTYSAMMSNSKNPLDFQTTDFTMAKEQKKEGEWEITLKPKDNTEIQNCIFNFYDNGSAKISITFINRSSIFFTGTVSPRK